ncbi:MAG: RluA family pseudouridine synthase [Solobacterium sp.]|nr:RluA family pseudouridine synthase [Solobacterium sp.]MBQ6532360.1 RluA family pseudouridine synthase [Solobacterium sp.]MBR0214941.1 RluA family pseudouridine synthase [Solobacterium sp.]
MERTLTYRAEKETTVGQVLKTVFALSRHEISRLKFQQGLFVNGRQAYVRDVLKIGDLLMVRFREQADTPALTLLKPEIFYADRDLVMVNKPAGIPVHPAHGHLTDSLGTAVQAWYAEQGETVVIHAIGRLDREVSGLMVYALNRPAAARLYAEKESGIFRKEYLAVCTGWPEQDEGCWDEPLLRTGRKTVLSNGGRPARTDYRVLARGCLNSQPYALLGLRIQTGRTHQIRAHAAGYGHPLAGDSLYGGSGELLSRAALHCFRTELVSPFTQRKIIREAPLPDDMKYLVEQLGGFRK